MGAQGALVGTKAALAREEGRVAAAERARAALEAVWASNRRRGGAARTVQRAWRAWRVRGLLQQGHSAAQVCCAGSSRVTLSGQGVTSACWRGCLTGRVVFP